MKSSESKYSQCLYFTANALARKVEKLAIESWKPAGLPPSHAYLLLMVLEEPGQQPGSISQHLQLTPSTVTRLIEKLEEKKLIIRTTEGKITNVYPTPKAKLLLPILTDCIEHFYQACNKLIGKEESSKMLSKMHSLADKM